MGVHGLWELLSPVGHRVSNEHVRNKVLAVDVSIWLTQFVKAMRDAEGAQLRNAHLLGVFRRCVKLLFLSVRPVLVFDGATPALKRRTLASRRAQRERHAAKLRRLAERMLVNQMRQQVVGAAIKRRRSSQPLRPPSSTPNDSKDADARRDIVVEEEDRIEPAASNSGPRHINAAQKRPRLRPLNSAPIDDNGGQECLDEEYRIDPTSQRPTTAASGDDGSADPQKDDEAFAADIADEEEAMKRDRDFGPISLPDDLYELDDEAVVSLPPNVQSEVFKQIKLHQRAKHRERMMLRQRDPSEFSKTQIEGFLQFTALNRKISSVRNAINSQSGVSQRIASDSGRQYVLEEGPTSYAIGHGTDSDDRDTLLGPDRSSAKNVPADILARIRTNRDDSLRYADARADRILESKRTENASRSGVGWASRVLEGHGGLTLGGKSALRNSAAESDESSDLEKEPSAQGSQRQINRVTQTRSESDEDDDDDIEWEDGAEEGNAANLTVPVLGAGHFGTEPENGKEDKLVQSRREHGDQHEEDDAAPDRERGDDKVKVADLALPASDKIDSPEEAPSASEMLPYINDAPKGRKPDHSIVDSKNRVATVPSKQDDSRDFDDTNESPSEAESGPRQQKTDDESEGSAPRLDLGPVSRVESAKPPGKGNQLAGENINMFGRSTAPNRIKVGKMLVTNTENAEQNKENVGTDQCISAVGASPSTTRKQRIADDEEDREIQMAIALSLMSADSNSKEAAKGASGSSRGSEEVAIENLDSQGSIRKLPLPQRNESQFAIKSTNRRDATRQLSKLGSIRTEPGTSAQPKQKPTSELDGSSTASRATEAISVNPREAERAIDVQTSESMHFEAADMSSERMKEIRDELDIEAQEIRRQKNSQQGAAESVSDEMYAETRDLLKLFGIPYLEAPTEAEAQCAFLNMENVVDGVITEDSDAFLFGAKAVYRRLFSEGRFAEAYEAVDIKNNLGLDRCMLIRLAYLLGSDYTSGVRGVGVVNSMEILEAFPGERGLEEFREWMKQVTLFDEEPDDSLMKGTSQDAVRRRFCWKHRNMKRNWDMRDGFPNSAVAEAYNQPHVDTNTEKFKWGKVDFSGLAQFCWEKFGWEQDQFNACIGPLRKKLGENSGMQQRTIDEYFRPHRFAKIRSERLQTAVRGMAGDDAKELMAAIGPRIKKRKAAPISHMSSVPSDEEEAMLEALDKTEGGDGVR